MPVRPYLLVSDSVLAAVAGRLRSLLGAWCKDWGVAADVIDFNCERTWEVTPLPGALAWRAARNHGESSWWYATTAQWHLQVQHALFPPTDGEAKVEMVGSLAAEAASAASNALFAALSSASRAEEALAPPAATWMRGTGALQLRLGMGGQELYVVADHAAVLDIARTAGVPLSRAAPLAPVSYRNALRNVGIGLPLEIGRAEVGLGSLMMLGVGDVIRLDTLADQPLTVRGPGGGALFDAYLGLAGKYVALEVARRD